MRALLFLIAATAFAQSDSPNFTASLGNAAVAYTSIFHYTGGNLDYVCKAKSQQPPAAISVSSVSNANPGIITTAAAHGFYYDSSGTPPQHFVALITGLTGNWTPLNGYQVLYPASTTTLTTAVNTSSFGAVTGTLVVTTGAPNTLSPYWAIQALSYDSSNNLRLAAWAVQQPSPAGAYPMPGGTTFFQFTCPAPSGGVSAFQ